MQRIFFCWWSIPYFLIFLQSGEVFFPWHLEYLKLAVFIFPCVRNITFCEGGASGGYLFFTRHLEFSNKAVLRQFTLASSRKIWNLNVRRKVFSAFEIISYFLSCLEFTFLINLQGKLLCMIYFALIFHQSTECTFPLT